MITQPYANDTGVRETLGIVEAAISEQGWDVPPYLFAVFELKEPDPQGHTMLVVDVPGFDVGMRIHGEVTTSIESVCRALRVSRGTGTCPAVPPGLVATVLITEAWMVEVKPPPGVPDRPLGEALASLRPRTDPRRVETRMTHVAGADGSAAILLRKRDEPGPPQWVTDPEGWNGAMVSALLELTTALKDATVTPS
jgi:hypothetical protein